MAGAEAVVASLAKAANLVNAVPSMVGVGKAKHTAGKLAMLWLANVASHSTRLQDHILTCDGACRT